VLLDRRLEGFLGRSPKPYVTPFCSASFDVSEKFPTKRLEVDFGGTKIKDFFDAIYSQVISDSYMKIFF